MLPQPKHNNRIVQQAMIRMVKVKALEITALDRAYVAEALVMAEVKAWLSTDVADLLFVVVDRSNFHLRKQPQMLALLGMTFRDEAALLGTTANPRETSREIGVTSLLRVQHHRTSKVRWVTSRVSNNNNNNSSLAIAIAAQ